jgi:16S rRNA processing protein RimM
MTYDSLVVAQVVGAHGLRGALRCRIVTDFPQRFRRGTAFGLQRTEQDEAPLPVTLRSAQITGEQGVLRFDELPDRTTAEAWRGADVVVAADQAVSLPPGQFFWRDIVGLRVEDLDAHPLGTVEEILRTGANDVYVARGPLGEVLVPAISEVVKAIEPEQGRIVIDPLPGLLPDPPRRRQRS